MSGAGGVKCKKNNSACQRDWMINMFSTRELHRLAVDDEVRQFLGNLPTLLLALRKVKLLAQLHVEHLHVQVGTGRRKHGLAAYYWSGGWACEFLTFPLLWVVLSDFFILFGISSAGCSSLSTGLFPSGLSSRMLSKRENAVNEGSCREVI